MSRDFPYFPFYAEDFAAGTAAMSPLAVGIYSRCLCHQWSHGSLPDDLEAIGRLSGATPEEAAKAWPSVCGKFKKQPDGTLQNARMEKERQQIIDQSKRRTKAGKKGAKARWQTHSDGNATAMPNECEGDGKTVPRGSGSGSGSSVLIDLPKILDNQPFRDAFALWLAFKKERRESYKPAGMAGVIAAAEKRAKAHGLQAVIDAMETARANGWQGWDQKSLFGANNGNRSAASGWKQGSGQRYPG